MRVLALDTTTRAGSVALVDDDRVVDERSGDASRTHAERLPGEIIALLAAHALTAGRRRSVRGRVRSRLVHRAADRHRDDSGAGVRRTAPDRRRVGARGARADRHAATRRRAIVVGAWMDAHRGTRCSRAVPRRRARRSFSADGSSRSTDRRGRSRGDAGALARAAPAIAAFVLIGDGACCSAPTSTRRRGLMPPIVPAPLLAGAIGRMAVAQGAARRRDRRGRRVCQPLYVRRPDAEMAQRRSERCEAALERSNRWPLDDRASDDRRTRSTTVLRDRRGVVHQSVDARDVSRRARERGRLVLLPCARRRAARSSASARSGACSTSCTSTTSRSLPEQRRRGVGDRRCCAYVLREGARWARSARRWRCGDRTTRRAGCTSGSDSPSPASGAATTRKPVEDALVLWREQSGRRLILQRRLNGLC